MSAPVAAGPSPSVTPGGVRLERLRAGRADETLFLVPGLEADPNELKGLVAAFTGPQEVYAVAPRAQDAHDIEQMAELMVGAIRTVQPSGPYRLGGYSFGGLIALEMAQQLRVAGEAVDTLVLVEAVYDERYWPRGIWLRALVRRTGRQLLRIARMNPVRATGELRLRGVRLVQRVLRRNADAEDPLRAGMSGETEMGTRAYAAIGRYRPRFYAGSMTVVASSVDRHFGCDTVRLWSGYADRLDIERVDGDHLTVMQEPESAAAVARVIDHRLALSRKDWTGLRPVPGFARPMILTTMRWFSAARLAHALAEAGFAVSACRPRAHPLELVDGLTADCRLHRWRRLRSVAAAIRKAGPDLILPDDERALALLRRLHRRVRTADPDLAALLARSLGDLDSWPSITSRTGLAKAARNSGVPAPATDVVDSAQSLTRWVGEHGVPLVLKTDGSWGGRGVAVVRDGTELRAAWRTVSNPPRLARGIKRLLVNVEAGPLLAWLRRAHPVVNAQKFVAGREAIVTVACLDGAVQALVCLEVAQESEAKGPAAVVRIIDHPAMADAARKLVARFGLSGFCGFDFMLTETGEARLLELNPRVTPTAYLLVEGDYRRSRTIALFPAELVLTNDTSAGVAGVLDIPVRAPSLIHFGEQSAMRRHRATARMARRLKQRLSPARY